MNVRPLAAEQPERISVVGLGKLGLGMAASFAARGFSTWGVDLDPRIVDAVNRHQSPIQETGLSEMLAHSTLRASTDPADAIAKADTTVIMLPTPSSGDGAFSNRFVEAAFESLGAALHVHGKPNHTFVLSSTVMPTSLEEDLIPCLERACRRKLNHGVNLCYCPDFVALGSVVRDYLNPDFVLIGESCPEAGARVESIYRRLVQNDAPIFRMSLVSAEIAKVSLNWYITLKISFANTLANLCERVPGADVDAITNAIGRDRRIAPYYLRGGLAYGGTCFPRDTRAFQAFARKCNYPPILTDATDAVNELQGTLLQQLVEQHLPQDRRVSLLGMAFKPNTPVVEASPAVHLAQQLAQNQVRVSVYDPLAMDQARLVLGDSVTWCSSAAQCVQASSLTVLLTPWKEFLALDPAVWSRPGATVIDCWRALDPSRLGNAHYVALGRAPQAAVPA